MKFILNVCLILVLPSQLSIAEQVFYKAEDIASALLAYKDSKAHGGKCLAIDVSPVEGKFIEVELPDKLGPGLYRAGLVARISSRSEPMAKGLSLLCSIEDGKRTLTYLNLDAEVYQRFDIEFEIRKATWPMLTIRWEHDAEVHKEALGVTVAQQDTRELIPDLLEKGPVDLGEGDEELAILQDGRDLKEAGKVYVAIDSVLVNPLTYVGAIRKIYSEKVHYEPGAETFAEVTVVNYQSTPLQGEVLLELGYELDGSREVGRKQITIEPDAAKAVRFEFNVGQREFGQEMRVSLHVDGKEVHRGSDVFGVSENVWKIGISGQGWSAGGSYGWRNRMDYLVKLNRENYANYYEAFAWAPSDYDDMTPDTEEFWSGQTQYHGTITDCRAVIDGLHKHGIKAITYGKSCGGGLPGFETFRKHPDWYFRYNSGVGVEGGPEVDFLDRMRALDFSLGALDGWQSWQGPWVNSGVKEAVVFGAEEIVRSARMLKWDGIRWDGQFVAYGPDGHEISAANTKLVKEIVNKEFPKFVHGYNYLFPQYSDKQPEVNNVPLSPGGNLPDFEECARGGGLIMDEGLRDFSNRNFSHRIMWVFAGAMALEGDWVRNLGGYYLAIGFDRATILDSLYNRIFLLASGGRPYGHRGESSIGHFWKFATRYSCLVFDNTRRRLANPDEVIKVISPHPCWWQDFTFFRKLEGNRRQIVVNLMGKPENERFNELRQPPPPLQENVQLDFKLPKGWRPVKAWQVSMELDPEQNTLPVKGDGQSVGLTLPTLRYWSMVVLEIEEQEGAESFQFTDPVNLAREGYKKLLAEEAEASRKKGEQAGVLRPKESPPVAAVTDAGLLAKSEIEPIKNPELKRNGVPDILLAKGVYHWMYSMEEAIGWAGGANIREAKINMKGGWMQGANQSMPDMPKTFDELSHYDLVIMNNVPANYMTLQQRYALEKFVEAGGSLFVIGGEWSLDRGGFQDSFFEELLPCEMPIASPDSTTIHTDGLPLRAAESLRIGSKLNWNPIPRIFCTHPLKPKDAKVLLFADEHPLLFHGKYKQGKVAVFAGSTMGLAPENKLPFWHWDGLPRVLAEVITELLKGSDAVTREPVPEVDRDAGMQALISISDLESEQQEKLVRNLCAICDKEIAEGLVAVLGTGIQLPLHLCELIARSVHPFVDSSFKTDAEDAANAQTRELRAAGTALLGKAAGMEANPLLFERLEDIDALIQRSAAAALADVASNENIKPLIKKLNEVKGKLGKDDEGMSDLATLNHNLMVALYRSGYKPGLGLLISGSEHASAQIVRFERRKEALLEQAGTAFKLSVREYRSWIASIERSKARKIWWATESRRLAAQLEDIPAEWFDVVFEQARSVDEPSSVSLMCRILGRLKGREKSFIQLISARNTVLRSLAFSKVMAAGDAELRSAAGAEVIRMAESEHHFDRLFALNQMRMLDSNDQHKILKSHLADIQPDVRIRARALLNTVHDAKVREKLAKIRSPYDEFMVVD
ncbi:MAG: glutamine amidotransferase [Planctomycetota bacterium]|nr:glutamine amidotransferase [Planctomycetota bacterium]